MADTVERRWNSGSTAAWGYARGLQKPAEYPLAASAGLLTVAQYAAAGVGLLETIVAARLLGPGDYGAASLILAYPALLWSLLGIKSVSVTSRYVSAMRAAGRYDQLHAVCKLGFALDCLLACFTLGVVGATASWMASHVYRLPDLAWLMLVSALSLPFSSLAGTSWAVLTAWDCFRWLALMVVLYPGLKLAFVVTFLLLGWGVPGMVGGLALGEALTGLLMAASATWVLGREGAGFWWSASLRSIRGLRHELFGLFGWNYLTVTLSGVLAQLPLMLLGRLRGLEEAAFYRLATSVATAGSYLESSLGKVSYPLLSARLGTNAGEDVGRTLRLWTRREGVLAAALMLLGTLLLPFLIPLVFGGGYAPMAQGAQVLMAAGALSALFFWLNPYYYAAGRLALWAKATAVYTALVLGAGWLAIERWGFWGMAVVLAVGKLAFLLALLGRAEHWRGSEA